MLPASSYHTNTGFVIVLVGESIVLKTTSSPGNRHNGSMGSTPFTVIAARSSPVAPSLIVNVTEVLSASFVKQNSSLSTPT